MKSTYFAFCFVGSLVAATVGDARDARACGGCLHEAPRSASEAESVITDHRIVLSIVNDTTTLWDQVEYSGPPGGFAWVLPIRGAVDVGVGNDDFINVLDTLTQVTVVSPTRYCSPASSGGAVGAPLYGGGGGGGGGGCGASFSTLGSSSSDPGGVYTPPAGDSGTGWVYDSGVYIGSRSVVGPYATVQIHGTTSAAIISWLRANSYVIPDAIVPILDTYAAEGFDFLAVRLNGDASTSAMQPIRVSWSGKIPQLPLRMVAAGIGSTVGLKLFVVADGRWTTQTFPSFTISGSDLTWDWGPSRSDYDTVRDSKVAALGGAAFDVESSIDLSPTTVAGLIPPPPPPPPPCPSALPSSFSCGSFTPTAGQRVCSDAALMLAVACFGTTPSDAVHCEAARSTYAGCMRCVDNWVTRTLPIGVKRDTQSCAAHIDPTDTVCPTADACAAACERTTCGTCNRESVADCNRAITQAPDCSGGGKGVCYDFGKHAAECASSGKYDACSSSDLIAFLAAACRDGGDFSHLTSADAGIVATDAGPASGDATGDDSGTDASTAGDASSASGDASFGTDAGTVTSPPDTGLDASATADGCPITIAPDAASDASADAVSDSAPYEAPAPYDAGTPPPITPDMKDVDVAFGGSSRRVTRLRAALAVSDLKKDLVLAADLDQSQLSGTLTAANDINWESVCPSPPDAGVAAAPGSTYQSSPRTGACNCEVPTHETPIAPNRVVASVFIGALGALGWGARRRLRRR